MSDQTTETTVDTTAPAAEQQATLQINDILLAAQVIQLATTRGAFRAEEFTQIGGVYDRLVAFLQSSGAIKPAASGEQSAEETPAA